LFDDAKLRTFFLTRNTFAPFSLGKHALLDLNQVIVRVNTQKTAPLGFELRFI
jgi:hypothetical protein